jgi:hypothetical protein
MNMYTLPADWLTGSLGGWGQPGKWLEMAGHRVYPDASYSLLLAVRK